MELMVKVEKKHHFYMILYIHIRLQLLDNVLYVCGQNKW
jgi:hypothetical protein